jgi:hypothetical protein
MVLGWYDLPGNEGENGHVGFDDRNVEHAWEDTGEAWWQANIERKRRAWRIKHPKMF